MSDTLADCGQFAQLHGFAATSPRVLRLHDDFERWLRLTDRTINTRDGLDHWNTFVAGQPLSYWEYCT